MRNRSEYDNHRPSNHHDDHQPGNHHSDVKGLPGSASTWTKRSPSGTLPAARADQSMIYDSATDRVIMFGGADTSSEFWSYTP